MHASGKRNQRHLLEGLWVSVEEELVLQEVSVVAELQHWVPGAAGQFPQPGLRVGRQHLLRQHIATSPDIDDEEVKRVSDAGRRRLAEENTGVKRHRGGVVAVDLRRHRRHWAGGEAHGGGGGRGELVEKWRVRGVRTKRPVYFKPEQLELHQFYMLWIQGTLKLHSLIVLPQGGRRTLQQAVSHKVQTCYFFKRLSGLKC